MRLLTRIQESLGGKKPVLPVLPNGILKVDDPQFTSVAAVHENGDCFVAAGYMHQDVFRDRLMWLQDSELIPENVAITSCTHEQIRELYLKDGAGQSMIETLTEGQTQGQRQLEGALAAAAESRASDLKIFLRDSCTEAGTRVTGREFPFGPPWTRAEGVEAINCAFNAQDPGSGEPTLTLSGTQSFSISARGKLTLPSNVTKLRCQVGPHEGDTALQTHLVIRLFYRDDPDTGTIEELGFDEEILGKLAQARANLRGGVIFGGETGDGKTTTLSNNAARLYQEHDERISLVTLEDPVEIRLPGSTILQIPLMSAGEEEDRDRHYGKKKRHFVRINPDVGIISEIRDRTSADSVLEYIRSGHQLYTTVHIDCANGILFRLIAMGVASEELAQPGLIRLLIKQTLLPLLCDHCKQPLRSVDLSERDKMVLAPLVDDRDKLYVRNPDGCDACRRNTNEVGRLAWSGYQREIAVGEVIEPDIGYLKFVRERDAIGALEHWLKPRGQGGLGGTSIQQKMTELALQGRVDPRDVVRKKGDLLQRMSAEQKASLKWGTNE